MPIVVTAVGRPEVPPITMSDRFRTEIAYFMSLPGEAGVPDLGESEYWVEASRAARWLEEGVFRLVSPLDSASQAEIEITEEQEAWLEWLTTHGVQHLRLFTAT